MMHANAFLLLLATSWALVNKFGVWSNHLFVGHLQWCWSSSSWRWQSAYSATEVEVKYPEHLQLESQRDPPCNEVTASWSAMISDVEGGLEPEDEGWWASALCRSGVVNPRVPLFLYSNLNSPTPRTSCSASPIESGSVASPKNWSPIVASSMALVMEPPLWWHPW